MRRAVPWVLVFVFGGACGWVLCAGRAKREPVPPRGLDVRGDLVVRPDNAPNTRLRVHHVQVGDRAEVYGPPANDRIWTILVLTPEGEHAAVVTACPVPEPGAP